MANISITIPDAQETRVIRAVSDRGGYKPRLVDPATGDLVDNPQTRKQFVKEMLQTYLMDNVRAYEVDKAAEDARQAALAKTDSEITLS